METPPRLVTAPNRPLALWQSAAEEVVRQHPDRAHLGRAELLSHDLMRATAAHAAGEHSDPARMSRHYFEQAEHMRMPPGILGRAGGFLDHMLGGIDASVLKLFGVAEYSRLDPLWLEVFQVYAAYWAQGGGELKYRDWRTEGGGELSYSVIRHQLPDDAKVGLIGDWGTGMHDAEALLDQLLAQHDPAAIIHLGDIYYAGTPEECTRNVAEVLGRCFDRHGRRVPFFTLAGNHDYYDWGVGFTQLIDELPADDPSWRQPASYFCLRTAGGAWQFLAMDTGQGDTDPGDRREAPALRGSEVTWLRDKLAFPGRTILLSHHPALSAFVTVDPSSPSQPYLNRWLLDAVGPHLDRVAAWYFGHDHKLALYASQLGVQRARLVGSSAYESTTGNNPYQVVHPQVREEHFGAGPVRSGRVGHAYNHSYAVIDLAGEGLASYYQIPSWPGSTPVRLPPDQHPLLAQESLGSDVLKTAEVQGLLRAER